MNNQVKDPTKSASKKQPIPKKQPASSQKPASNQKENIKHKMVPNQKSAPQKTAPTEKLKQQLQSSKADASGLRFEQNVANFFRSKGWNPRQRVEMLGYEYDLFAENSNGWEKKYLVVECKNKKMVSADDICHFIVKVTLLSEKLVPSNLYSKPQLYAYLCHTGEVDKDAENVAKTHNPQVLMLKF